jgi:uncharacterized protein (DUF3084 family)
VTAALPPTSLDAARDEIARLRGELEKYVGHEPTVREEMAYIRSENDRLEAELAKAQQDLRAYRAANASWLQVVVRHVANGLTSSDDTQHAAALQLTTALDGVGLNIDLAVDDEVDRFTDMSARQAWKSPLVRRAEWEAQPGPF